MRKLFFEERPVPFIEGVVNGFKVFRRPENDYVLSMFYVQLPQGQQTPEGTSNPMRYAEGKVELELQDGDRVRVYQGWTVHDRLDTAMGIQKLNADIEELYVRNQEWREEKPLLWQVIH